MLNEQERIERKSQIGASEVHKLFNFNNKGAIDLWKEKLGLEERKEFSNPSVVAGNILEETCLIAWFKEKGIDGDGYELNGRIEHKEIKGFVSSLDALILPINELETQPIENKTIQIDKLIELDKLPRNYLIQLQCQIECVGSKKGTIIFNGLTDDDIKNPLKYVPMDFKRKEFVIEKDEELISEIKLRVQYFLWCVKHEWKPTENDYQLRRFVEIEKES